MSMKSLDVNNVFANQRYPRKCIEIGWIEFVEGFSSVQCMQWNDKSRSYINTCVSTIPPHIAIRAYIARTDCLVYCCHHYSTNIRANNGATRTANTRTVDNRPTAIVCEVPYAIFLFFIFSHTFKGFYMLHICICAWERIVWVYRSIILMCQKKIKKKKFNQLHTLHSTRARKLASISFYSFEFCIFGFIRFFFFWEIVCVKNEMNVFRK